MSLESALWEATRPAFRVRYIHDPTGPPLVPLYASYGVATARTARAKLARIVRRAPEVVVKVTGRQRGGGHVKAHLEYIGRKGDIDIETRDGEILTSKDDIAERAEEWSDTLQWRSRPTVSSVSLILSMPAGTDPGKVLGAVRALAHAELSDNHDYVHGASHRYIAPACPPYGAGRRPRPQTVQSPAGPAPPAFASASLASCASAASPPKPRRGGREAVVSLDRAWRSSNCAHVWRTGRAA